MFQSRRHTRALAAGLGLVMLAAFGQAALALPRTYDFEGAAAGTIVKGVTPNGEMMSADLYPGLSFSVVGNQTANTLCIFDTAHPTGGDFDLGTPNEGFGGPGRGAGGRPGMPGQNKVPQGKVLIIPEDLVDVNGDGLVDDPDDNAHGGVITIRWDTPGVLYSMTFIDIEELGATIDVYRGDQLVQSFPIPALGDNSQVSVNTETRSMIDLTVVTFPGSGALAAMTFEFFVVPTEPTTWSGVKTLYRER